MCSKFVVSLMFGYGVISNFRPISVWNKNNLADSTPCCFSEAPQRNIEIEVWLCLIILDREFTLVHEV